MTTLQQSTPTAYLIIRQGGRWSDVFRLQRDQSLIIGRSSANAIVVPDDRSSRQHAEVYFEAGAWKVKDLSSRNGTQVDGTNLTGPHTLANGQVIQVASCRVSFVDSIADAFPGPDASSPLSDEGGNNQQTIELDAPPAITHRTQLDAKSTELAYLIAKETTWESACEVALASVIKMLSAQAGGILGVNGQDYRLTILAAQERSGKAYHRVSDFLSKSVLSDGQAVLARNIRNDAAMSDIQSSQASSTTSVLCAPIKDGPKIFGLLHIYTREDEPMLTPKSLEIALTASQILAVAHEQLGRQRQIQSKLTATQKQVKQLKQQLNEHQLQHQMIGKSPTLVHLQSQLQRVATTQANVLLRGESGVGKELAAREIHALSKRADGPFVAINCGALTPSLLESELFGHEKGSFTGATERKAGKFEIADGGTLMLDEVGEMSPEIQVKFLRVLEGQPFERVGGSKPIQVDVRVVAATNRDLEQAVKSGEFRSDLYFRLRVVELSVPSLRERSDDILPLADFFLQFFRQRSGHGPTGFSPRAKQAMLEYAWPGNIRELRNSVERASVLAVGMLAELEDLALSPLDMTADRQPVAQSYQEQSLEELEQQHILATLAFTKGQKSRAASILGIERSTLDRKLKKIEEGS
ncbi:MAG: sigma 54-interacting transcriptional regulator [Pirellulaceae bacterium]|nr:sigma 54-interacting transcriptional regulator [Pirellulaceae bacterium]